MLFRVTTADLQPDKHSVVFSWLPGCSGPQFDQRLGEGDVDCAPAFSALELSSLFADLSEFDSLEFHKQGDEEEQQGTREISFLSHALTECKREGKGDGLLPRVCFPSLRGGVFCLKFQTEQFPSHALRSREVFPVHCSLPFFGVELHDDWSSFRPVVEKFLMERFRSNALRFGDSSAPLLDASTVFSWTFERFCNKTYCVGGTHLCGMRQCSKLCGRALLTVFPCFLWHFPTFRLVDFHGYWMRTLAKSLWLEKKQRSFGGGGSFRGLCY